MATEVWNGPLGELRTAGTAGGGTALTTAVTMLPIPDGAAHLFITPRNFAAGAVVAQLAKNPYLFVVRTTDNLVSGTDYSQVAQDADATTEVVLDSQSTAADGDYLYVGAPVPFRGVYVDVSADANEANGTASVLTVNYWNGTAWANAGATDGTINGGATLAVDGAVTWTVPSDWVAATLIAIASPTTSGVPHARAEVYWTRWQVSAALDANVKLDAMLAMNRSTTYWEQLTGVELQLRFNKGPFADGCLEARTDQGTANLIVNIASRSGSKFV